MCVFAVFASPRHQLGAAEHATAIQRLRTEVTLACGVDTSSTSSSSLSSLGAFASLLDKRLAVLPALLPEPVHATLTKNAPSSAIVITQSNADAASASASAKSKSAKSSSAASSSKDGKEAKEWSTPVPAAIRAEWLLPGAHAADPTASVGTPNQTQHSKHGRTTQTKTYVHA
jgi:hypothetical protein